MPLLAAAIFTNVANAVPAQLSRKMATMWNKWIREEVHVAIQFWLTQITEPTNIHRQSRPCMCRCDVQPTSAEIVPWIIKRFGKSYEPRHPYTSQCSWLIPTKLCGQRDTEPGPAFKLSQRNVWNTVHEFLVLENVQHMRLNQQKLDSTATSLTNIQHYKEEGDDFLSCIVTCNETQMHH